MKMTCWIKINEEMNWKGTGGKKTTTEDNNRNLQRDANLQPLQLYRSGYFSNGVIVILHWLCFVSTELYRHLLDFKRYGAEIHRKTTCSSCFMSFGSAMSWTSEYFIAVGCIWKLSSVLTWRMEISKKNVKNFFFLLINWSDCTLWNYDTVTTLLPRNTPKAVIYMQSEATSRLFSRPSTRPDLGGSLGRGWKRKESIARLWWMNLRNTLG